MRDKIVSSVSARRDSPAEAELTRRMSRLIRTTRSQLGLSQVEVSHMIGMSQANFSKVENGLLSLDAPKWFILCEATGLSLDSALTGYVDFRTRAVLKEGGGEHGFKLPRNYASSRGSKVRALLPLLQFAERSLGVEVLEKVFEGMGVDPDFFLCLDNQISIEFGLDFAQYLIQKQKLKPESLSELVSSVASPLGHGKIGDQYLGMHDFESLLTTLVDNASFYECNFEYRLEESSKGRVVISATPHDQVLELSKHPAIRMFLCHYRRSYFQAFGGMGGGVQPILTESQCCFNGAHQCIFVASAAN
jgi:transcriptional regulator with XRE-family HTH domain